MHIELLHLSHWKLLSIAMWNTRVLTFSCHMYILMTVVALVSITLPLHHIDHPYHYHNCPEFYSHFVDHPYSQY